MNCYGDSTFIVVVVRSKWCMRVRVMISLFKNYLEKYYLLQLLLITIMPDCFENYAKLEEFMKFSMAKENF